MEGSPDGEGLAEVIRLVPRDVLIDRPKSCFICIWSVITPNRTYCSLFTEQIDQEMKVAEECEAYEDDRDRA